MSTPPLEHHILEETVDAIRKTATKQDAANLLGIPVSTMKSRYKKAIELGLETPSDKSIAKIDGELGKELAEARSKIRTLEVAAATHKKEQLTEDYVKRVIIKLASRSPNPPKWLAPNKKKTKDIAGVPTLFASDWHWGEVVDPNQINGVNEYDITIAQNRARKLIYKTIELLKNNVAPTNYPGIVFVLGGDMVSGDIHEELMATNDKEIMPVVMDLYGTLAWCIETLADAFGNVFVPCVSGNHGRNTHKIRNKGRNFTSFDWLVYQFLAKRFESDSRIQFLIPDGSDAYYQIYNHKYLLTHGDQFRGGDGVIGAIGPIIRGDHRKRSRNSQIDMEYNTLIIGHFHQLIQFEKLIVNGSLKGYCEYSYANNFSFEPPRQALWLTHPEHGITISMPVHVGEFHKSDLKSEWTSWSNGSRT